MRRIPIFLAVAAASTVLAAAAFFLMIYLVEGRYDGYWGRLSRFLGSRELGALAFLFGVLCAAGLSLAESLSRLRALAHPVVSGALAGALAPVAYVLWLTFFDGGWDSLRFRMARDWDQVLLFVAPFSLSVAAGNLLLANGFVLRRRTPGR
ncbi:MAG: hypothetical protein M1598_07725 [Actinobacteria bacterium]|nr:hypothetical protein [Actinomycetota bacterium]